jgi:hypothetical protein
MGIGFHADIYEKKKKLEKYIGKYQVIYTSTPINFSGKIKNETNDFIILNPFQGTCYHDGKGLKKMIKEDSIIPKNVIIGREPTTKKDLENYCKLINNQSEDSQNKK